MASNLFGVIAYDRDGRPLSQKEREEIARNERTMPTVNDEGWFTPSDLPPLSTVNDADDSPVKKSGGDILKDLAEQMLSIPVGAHYPNAQGQAAIDRAKDPNANPKGIFAVGSAMQGIIGSTGFIILGIVLIILAFLTSDFGKKTVKMVATRGAAK